MRKTDKKMDNALIEVLTEVCDIAQDNYDGFKWITHFVNYNNFSDSLSIVCIYDTNEQLKKTDVNGMHSLINEKLLSIDVNVRDIRRHVNFDTEENCNRENNGSWNERFK
ncbi:MAG: hypothetical protein ACI9GW_000551 [Halieaceae bacterium]|jgi:hypothetical protein